MAFFSEYPFPAIFPSSATLGYIKRAFSSSLLYRSIGSSILVGSLSASISTILGFFIGRALVKYNPAKKNFWMSFFTIPLFFPAVSMFIGAHIIMLRSSVANTLLSVVVSHLLLTIPYAMTIAITYFTGINKDLENISHLLGASGVQTFNKIVFPLLKNGLVLSLQMTFLISISEYFAVFLIGGGSIITLSGVLYPYISNFDSQNVAIYMAVFLVINILIFSFLNLGIRKGKNLY